MRAGCLWLASALVVVGCSGAKTPSAPSGAASGSTATTPPAPSSAGSESTTPTPTGRTLASLALCCGNDQVALDTQRQLEAHGKYTDGSVTDVTAAVTSWASTAPSIATISNTGMVTAHAAGDFQVTASYLGVQGAWTLRVRTPIAPGPAPPTQGLRRITVDCYERIELHWQQQVVAYAAYADGAYIDITGAMTSWTSSNPSIASISTTGVMTAVATGTTRISATYAGFRGTCNLEVHQSIFRPPALDALTGYVREQTLVGKVGVSKVDVEVIGGPLNGRVVPVTYGGFFRIDGLKAERFELAIRGRGYAPARVPVAELGGELEVLLAPAPGVVSDVLRGEVCGPTRAISRTFTPRAAGFLRVTDEHALSVDRELYANGSLVNGDVADNEDIELRARVQYEFRLTGVCDYIPTNGWITFLRPAE